MSACALTKEQALNLIKKIDYSEPAKSTFYQELDNNLYDKYKSFASNPLLLTIMLLTFSNHASIPAKLNDFYEAAFLHYLICMMLQKIVMSEIPEQILVLTNSRQSSHIYVLNHIFAQNMSLLRANYAIIYRWQKKSSLHIRSW